MAYSVRGKYSNQQKYSDRQFNQVLDLLTLKANESSILQEELQKSVDRSAKAAKKVRKQEYLERYYRLQYQVL